LVLLRTLSEHNPSFENLITSACALSEHRTYTDDASFFPSNEG